MKLKLSFAEKGLNLIRMGEKLDTSISNHLYDIDTSNIDGELEYMAVSFGDRKLNYKKLDTHFFDTKDIDFAFNVYVGFHGDNIVKKIVLDYSPADREQVLDMLIRLYGVPSVKLSSGFDGGSFPNSYWWKTDLNFRVYLSRENRVSYYYSDKEKLLN